MLRARMDVERIAKLVEAQGGFRTFAGQQPLPKGRGLIKALVD